MNRFLNRSGLLEAGFRKIGVDRAGKSVYKKTVAKFDLNDGMAFYNNSTRNRQVTEFAYLDDATDKVVQTATRRVGEYGESAKALKRSTKTEFTRASIKDNTIDTKYSHYTESQPIDYCVVEGKMPGTYSVVEHNFPNVGTEVGRRTDFVTYNTNGEILSRGRVRVPQITEGSENGLKEVWLYKRGQGFRPGYIQSSYTSHEITPSGRYVRGIYGTGETYTPEIKIGGVPKYTSFSDIKANNDFFTREFNG